MMPLGLLGPGEHGEIVMVKEGQGRCSGHGRRHRHGCSCRLQDMGLRVGKRVEVLSNGGGGPVLLKVDESRIAIGRGLAMKILVRR